MAVISQMFCGLSCVLIKSSKVKRLPLCLFFLHVSVFLLFLFVSFCFCFFLSHQTLALNQHLCFSSCLFLLNIPSDVTCLLRKKRNSMLLSGLTYFGTPITQYEVTNEVIWHEKSSDLQRATFMVVLADYNVESYLIITLWLQQFPLSRNQKCEGLRLSAKME